MTRILKIYIKSAQARQNGGAGAGVNEILARILAKQPASGDVVLCLEFRQYFRAR